MLTLAELAANPIVNQSRLVKVSGVAFQDPTGNFADNSEHVLIQDSTTFGFRTFFDSDYADTPVPPGSLNVTGIVRSVSNANFLSPRALTDITPVDTGGDPDYSDFSTQFAGGQGPLLDFDGDGVRNGLEYLFGVNSAGFTPTPQIVDGAITWPIDPTRTDVGYVVQTSDNLVDWDPVLAVDLDLSDPNAVRYVRPDGHRDRFSFGLELRSPPLHSGFRFKKSGGSRGFRLRSARFISTFPEFPAIFRDPIKRSFAEFFLQRGCDQMQVRGMVHIFAEWEFYETLRRQHLG